MYIPDFQSISEIFCPKHLEGLVADYTFLIKLTDKIFLPPFKQNDICGECGYYKNEIEYVRSKYLNHHADYSVWEVVHIPSSDTKMFSRLISALEYIRQNLNRDYLIPKFYRIEYRTFAEYNFWPYELNHHYLLDMYDDTFNSFNLINHIGGLNVDV